MKKIILIMLLAVTLNAQIADDKYKHLVAGFVIYSTCLIYGNVIDNSYWDKNTCLIPVAVAGVGKEVYDNSHGGTVEFADFAYTMAVPITFNVVLYRW